MPLVPFETLPDASRVWVFASGAPIPGPLATTLLAAVDDFLVHWHAHGAPLTVGRDWRDDRFVTIGVDLSHEAASGCSIDGLFRVLRGLEPTIGTSLVSGGMVYYRDASGTVASADRETFAALAERGEVTPETIVFDMSVTELGAWRAQFETAARDAWHHTFFPAAR